jgi:hypothetical protein
MERTKRSYRQHVCRGGTEDFMRRGRHVVLLLLMVAIAGVSGFHPCSQGQGSFRTRTSSAGLSKKMSRKSACRLSRRLELGAKSSSTDEDDDPQSRGAYNDDCFGLIFLSGLILTEDPIFTGTFLALSSSAAITTSMGKLPGSSRKVPAAVGGFTLLATPVLTTLLPGISQISIGSVGDSFSVDPSLVEVAVCGFSLLYGFVFSNEEQTS